MMNYSTTQRYGNPVPVVGGFQAALAAFRGHRYIEGEGGAAPTPVEGAPADNGTPVGEGAASTPAPSPATVAQQQQQQQQATPPAKPSEPQTFSRDYVQELREEAKANRIAHQEAQRAQQEAEQALAEAQAQLTQFQRENAVRAAAEGIANPALLLDSTSFHKSLEQVDLADAEAVKAAITAFVEQNSAYKATPSLPGTSGGTPTGGTDNKPTTLESAIAQRYSG